MKFFAAVATLSVGGAQAFFEQNDYSMGAPIGPAMWVMGDNGLQIYTSDGNTLLKNTPAADLCHEVASSYHDPNSPLEIDCSWGDVVSDGSKYVWASVSRGAEVLNVFSIDTGDMVATMPTCNRVFDLDYHAGRDEMYVRCMSADPEDPEVVGQVESFSTSTFATTRRAIELNQRNQTERAYGHIVADGVLGDSAYTVITDLGAVIELDLSSNVAVKEWPIQGMAGGFDIEFSRKNKHLFFHGRVCCTCGFPGADVESCGGYSPENVTVTLGPSANPGILQEGRCGTSCSGSAADQLGVIEFDTQTNSIVANHFTKSGAGARARVSPNGDFVFLLEDNAPDDSMRILRVGKNGQPSTIAFDIPLGFNHTMGDFAFMEDEDRMIAVMASDEKNVIHMANLMETNPKVHSLTYKSGDSTGDRRQIEFARGTDYVWISGRASEEISEHEAYVIEIPGTNLAGARLTKTLKVSPTKLKFIENSAREQLRQELFGSGSTVSSFQALQQDSEDSSPSTVSIVALVVGFLALAVGVANLMMMNGKKDAQVIDPGAKDPLVDPARSAYPQSDAESDIGMESVA